MPASRLEIFLKLARKALVPPDLARFLRFKFADGNEYPYFDLVDVFPWVGRVGALVPSRLDLDRPIFIAGLRRTGTTLFYRIMSSHPRLSLFNERFPGSGLNGLGEPTPANIWSVQDPAEFHAVMLRYLSPALRRKRGFWGVKLALEIAHPDPGSVSADGLRQIMVAFPQARVLGIVRDPRDFVLSAQRRAGHDTEWWVREYLAMSALFEDLVTRFPQRFMVCRYEEIVDRSVQTIERCCQFVGLRYHDAMLDSKRWSRKGPSEYPRHGIVARHGTWREATDADSQAVRAVVEACFPAASRFGYEAD